ncbi:MAG: hypothetical protein JW990_18470 [Thermoleophilia bacterium]|nr:hypothetical protein [Thermoleophilia bacterium]
MMATSPLREQLKTTAAQCGSSLGALTVLAPQNDPFRVDTPARHRDGRWLAETARELGLGERTIHLRGLHYMLIGRPKPDGTPYANTDADWTWLQADAGKAARWLGYLPFEQIVDQRNSAPVVEIWEPNEPTAYLSPGLDIEVPAPEDIVPTITVKGFEGVQPYKLVMFGEKASLAEVLLPLAREHHADLYLPTGEISDTLLHQMARIGANDGRPLVVLCFSDCDPAGWQMPISIARKLQALSTVAFPGLDFQVHRACLVPEQVRTHGLPSTPLKATELRGERWCEAMGVEQTEIDALASLRPDLLRTIAQEALAPFFDSTLEARVRRARDAWLDEAQEVVKGILGEEELEVFREQAAQKLSHMQDEIERLKAGVSVSVTYDDLPAFEIPEAELLSGTDRTPLIDSRWPFIEQCLALKEAKSYAAQATS